AATVRCDVANKAKMDPHRARRAADCSNRLAAARSSRSSLRPSRLLLKELPAGGGFGDVKSLRLDQLQEKLRELGEPSYRARQIADWLYEKRARSFDEMTDLPRNLRGRLAKEVAFDKIDIVRVLGSRDATRKFLFRLSDGD